MNLTFFVVFIARADFRIESRLSNSRKKFDLIVNDFIKSLLNAREIDLMMSTFFDLSDARVINSTTLTLFDLSNSLINSTMSILFDFSNSLINATMSILLDFLSTRSIDSTLLTLFNLSNHYLVNSRMSIDINFDLSNRFEDFVTILYFQ